MPLSFETEEHYERLAETYERNWEHSPEYVAWMNERIAERLPLSPGDRVADIGGGTGLFDRRLAESVTPDNPILCVDPSQHMLDQLPDDPLLRPVCATAEDVAAGLVALPYDKLDVILFKESIHHVKDIAGTFADLAGRLRPGGRILVVTLPKRLDYPLFQAALDRFASKQPDPEDILADMRAAGLDAHLTWEEFQVSVDRDHYIDLVRNRWMSALSTFDDAELAAGLEEIRARHPEPRISYVDRFAFVYGSLH